MRLDRFITLNLMQPFRQVFTLNPQPSTLSPALPILMYHGICDDPEPGVAAYYKTNTSPAVFRQHMQYLAENGYRTIRLEEAVEMIKRPGSSPEARDQKSQRRGEVGNDFTKNVVITFDDGLRNFYTHAFPVLQEFGFTATMFLATSFIGDDRRSFCPKGASLSTLNSQLSTGRECLTWEEVKELHESGISFGSHTENHPRLVDISWPEIEVELRNSKLEIEAHLGEPTTSFCYPFAFPQANRTFVKHFRTLLTDAGYDCCVTTEIGRVKAGDDPYRLKRLPVNSCDDPGFFRAKLEGGYDWLAAPQSVVKKFKSWRKDPGARNRVRVQTTEAISR